MEPEALKKYLESQRKLFKDTNRAFLGVDATIDNIDFSHMDLRDFDLSNLIFENSNFNGAKMPSMTSVTFDHKCNLDNTDWSNTVQKNIQFGGSLFQKNSEALIESINQLQLLNSGNVSDFEDAGTMKKIRLDSDGKDLAKIQQSVDDLTLSTSQRPQTLRITNANFARTKFENFFNYGDIDFSGSNFAGAVFKVIKAERKLSFQSPLTAGIDLTDANIEFIDN